MNELLFFFFSGKPSFNNKTNDNGKRIKRFALSDRYQSKRAKLRQITYSLPNGPC